ncbi:AAA family ATPase [Bacteroidales bacterium OttesenSCG-928-I14]|nr:AAA family ATPase [Bacteroidales bacterium OttesenSCG-928-I14]
MAESKEKHLIQWTINNIGPHENLNQNFDAGENGPIRIGIFSTNGGGKSSLSRQFRLLNIDSDKLPSSSKYITLGKNEAKFKFKLFNQDNTAEKYEFEINHSLRSTPQITNNSQLIFHVFNSDYVKESIEPDNFGQNKEIDGYIIGKDVIDLSKEKAELEKVRDKYQKTKNEIQSIIDAAKNELQGQGVRASTNEFKNFYFDNMIGVFLPSEEESYKSLKSLLKKLEGIPEDLSDVSFHKSFEIDVNFILDTITDLKKQISISTLSTEFKEKIRSKESFVKSGLSLIDENNRTCPFCEQNFQDEQLKLIDMYNAYIYDAETIHRTKLQERIKNINGIRIILEEKYREFLKIDAQFNKNKSYFPSFSEEALSIIGDPKELLWEKSIQIIEGKIKNVSLSTEEDKINIITELHKDVQNYTTNIVDFIIKNNSKIRKLNETKLNAGNEVLSLKKRMCNAKYIETKSSLEKQLEEEGKIKKEGYTKAESIKKSENKAKKSKKEIVVNTFNALIQFIFSDKYTFDKDNNYLKFKEHSLKASAHDVLSDGEKNVIAFCYYVAETHTLINDESDYDKLFFIIDDPISSMDFHYTYSLCRILERLHEHFEYSNRKKLRFILLTHNIEFMSILLRNNVIQKKYILTPGKFKELKKELVMPYHEHLSDIYKVANNAQEPTHTTPNSMRHVLETIAKFEDPNQDLVVFVDKNDILKNCSSLYNMIQDLSHGVVRSQPAITPDTIKQACCTILTFIDTKYKGQIDNVKKTI